MAGRAREDREDREERPGADPPAVPGPGHVVAGCRLERLIARGAHGVLYAVTDLAAGEGPSAWRALKLFAPSAAGTPAEAAEAAARFAREARALQRLQHPGIVRVHRAGAADGRPWLLMELLGGTDLTRYTHAARLLPEAAALDVAERVALALAHAHGQGVVHRDLKPANVMVDWVANRVVLTDFGVAAVEGAERTRTGLVLGSPAYMAPELLAGQPADARSDLYALGVLLFQLLTGRLPFDATALGELLRQVATAPPPDPAARRPGLPASLSALVRALLAKAPGDRPADATVLAAALAAERARMPPATGA